MDKIDLIIDALEKAKDGWQSFDEYEKALAAARELKALKPVAKVVLTEHLGMPIVQWVDLDRSFELDSGTPLYALDEVNYEV